MYCSCLLFAEAFGTNPSSPCHGSATPAPASGSACTTTCPPRHTHTHTCTHASPTVLALMCGIVTELLLAAGRHALPNQTGAARRRGGWSGAVAEVARPGCVAAFRRDDSGGHRVFLAALPATKPATAVGVLVAVAQPCPARIRRAAPAVAEVFRPVRSRCRQGRQGCCGHCNPSAQPRKPKIGRASQVVGVEDAKWQ